MMVKDQDYDSINSRVVYKWLNMNKDLYFMDTNKAIEIPRIDLTIDESERIDKLINEFKNKLIDFRPNYRGVADEMKKIKIEDEERQTGKKSISKESSDEYFLLSEKKKTVMKERGIDKLGLHEVKSFEVENQIIVCRSMEEAMEIYTDVYL